MKAQKILSMRGFYPENENIIFYNQSGINLIDESGAIDSTSLEKRGDAYSGNCICKKESSNYYKIVILHRQDKSVQYGIITYR